MKPKRFSLTIVLLLLLNILFTKITLANNWEVAFVIINDQGNPTSLPITVYLFNENTRNYDYHDSGYTSGNFGQIQIDGIWRTINGLFDILQADYINPTISLVPAVNRFLIRIGNSYYKLDFQGGTSYGDIVFFVQDGSISIASNTSNYLVNPMAWTDKTISLRNYLGDDYSSVSGKIFLNSEQINAGYTYVDKIREATTFPHTISGEDNQYISSYYRKWRKWSDNDFDISKTLSTANNYTYTANYARKLDVTFRNYFNSADQGGSIKLDDNSQNSPASLTLYDDGSYKLEAENTTQNNVYYWFDHWEFGGSNISSSNPLNSYEAPSHGTLQAVFNHKPVNTYRYLTFNDDEYGNPIRLSWQKHPLDNSFITQYAILRKVKHNGVMGSAVQIATISANGSSSYSYTDYDYLITNGYTDDLLYYDVRAFYSPNYSDEDYEAVYGEINLMAIDAWSNLNINTVSELPTEYKIDNYPNPFNPVTTITYQIPEDEFVTIKVFDILGKEVATLVNENKSAGFYSINFNGTGLTSGVYIYTMQVKEITLSKKILLAK